MKFYILLLSLVFVVSCSNREVKTVENNISTNNRGIASEGEYLEFPSEASATEVCKTDFKRMFWFSKSCRKYFAGNSIHQSVYNLAKIAVKTDHLSARYILEQGFNKQFQQSAFSFVFSNLYGGFAASGKNKHAFVAAMADAEFDLNKLAMCQSRTTLSSIINPITSSRSLNFVKILNCIHLFRNVVNVGPLLNTKILSCKTKFGLQERLGCLQTKILPWKEKQANPDDGMLENLKKLLDEKLVDKEKK